jgi:hypothetical protein
MGVGLLHQALGHERGQMTQRFSLVAKVAEGFGGVEGPASNEHGEAREERTFVGVEEIVAPVQGRPERSLPVRQVPRPTPQEGKPVTQPRQHGFGGQQADARRGELYGQGQPVQPSAQFDHRQRVLGRHLEFGPCGPSPLREQVNPLVPVHLRRWPVSGREQRHRRHLVPVFAPKT